MDRLTESYGSAQRLLSQEVERLSLPLPAAVPLKLREETGTLVSGLPRLLCAGDKEGAEALAVRLSGRLALADTPFARAEAGGGLILLQLSPAWFRAVLEDYAALDWPDLPAEAGLRRRDEGDRRFLLSYTCRRCRALARRDEERIQESQLPPALLCRLARPAGQEERIARMYWALPAPVRRDPALARAVGMAAGTALALSGGSFTKNSPLSHDSRYNDR